MVAVSTRELEEKLLTYLQRAETGESFVVHRDGKPVAQLTSLSSSVQDEEETRLTALEALGLLELPKPSAKTRFDTPRVPSRGAPASRMVIEDRH